MSRLLASLVRYSPLLLFVFVLVAVVQVGLQLGITRQGLDAALAAGAWGYAVGAGVLWLVVMSAVLHDRGHFPRIFAARWIVDVLDRLTNKGALERLMSGETQPIFIDATELAARLKAKVIGQDGVCDALAAQIRRRLALVQRGKPVGIFLLAGPPGTGKTYLGKTLANELQRKLLHLDMSQFSQPHAATQLFGSPKGYVGSDTYGKLTGGLRDVPDAVVLLDEIEKAHPDVHKKFLTAWNDGFVTEASDGRQIATTMAIFVLTTNAATEQLAGLATQYRSDPDQMRRGAVEALRGANFAPEVLNRIDHLFVFMPLQGLDIARVAALEIEAMIKGYGLEVEEGGIDPQLLFSVMQRQGRLGSSASSRDVVRAIEEAISDSLIDAKQRQVKRVVLIQERDQITAVASP